MVILAHFTESELSMRIFFWPLNWSCNLQGWIFWTPVEHPDVNSQDKLVVKAQRGFKPMKESWSLLDTWYSTRAVKNTYLLIKQHSSFQLELTFWITSGLLDALLISADYSLALERNGLGWLACLEMFWTFHAFRVQIKVIQEAHMVPWPPLG